MIRIGLNGYRIRKFKLTLCPFLWLLSKIKLNCNGDSNPFSANARIALSNGVCTLAQAKSHSIKLCAHFDAISSKPDLQFLNNKKMI